MCVDYFAILTKTTCGRLYRAAWQFLTLALFNWHMLAFWRMNTRPKWNPLNTIWNAFIVFLTRTSASLTERPCIKIFICWAGIPPDKLSGVCQEDPMRNICIKWPAALLLSCRTDNSRIRWLYFIQCAMMAVHSDLNSCCHAVIWNAETIFPFCLSVSSLELGFKETNKQTDRQKLLSRDWRRFVSYCLSEMDVGVSKSHVFLNYSPRALFSQWDTHLHGGAVGSSLLHSVSAPYRGRTSSSFCRLCNWMRLFND